MHGILVNAFRVSPDPVIILLYLFLRIWLQSYLNQLSCYRIHTILIPRHVNQSLLTSIAFPIAIVTSILTRTHHLVLCPTSRNNSCLPNILHFPSTRESTNPLSKINRITSHQNNHAPNPSHTDAGPHPHGGCELELGFVCGSRRSSCVSP